MTAGLTAHSIGSVLPPVVAGPGQPRAYQPRLALTLRPLLTRRRAVDFCRVATALCRQVPRPDQPAERGFHGHASLSR